MREKLMRKRLYLLGWLCGLLTGAAVAGPTDPRGPEAITLERIMSDPDWIGRFPRDPWWADDGQRVYWYRKRQGSDIRDVWTTDLQSGHSQRVPDEQLGTVTGPGGSVSRDGRWKVYAWQGDLFLRDRQTGQVRQLTRTTESESNPRFLVGDRQISFRRGQRIFVRDLESGLEFEPAELRFENDPAEKDATKPQSFLKQQQVRLFDIIRQRRAQRQARREHERDLRVHDPARVPPPWYLGDDVELRQASLSPDLRFMVLRVAPKQRQRGKREPMPQFVTESGYVETRQVRPKVAGFKPVGERLILLDLQRHEQHALDLSVLPGILDDPLADLRRQARQRNSDQTSGTRRNGRRQRRSTSTRPADQPRDVGVLGMRWTRDGRHVAIMLRSRDNKDRWIATVDLEQARLVPLHHLHDPAWINYRFNEFGWLSDNRTLWYLSEEDGYAHLYLLDVESRQRRRMTQGAYEVSSVKATRDGAYLYFVANRENPGVYEVYRVAVQNGKLERLTQLGGRNSYVLSPDETRLLVVHSTALEPPELYVQDAALGASARRLTHTVSPAYLALPWIEPRFVQVPTRHGRAVWSRLYLPPEDAGDGAQRPAVLFVHGAGYMQDAHQGWSYYFREHMFHSLLAYRGYVVLCMDYRGSAGYGRDWRTAIYRQMGSPELDDLEDGVRWLAQRHRVDPRRVGVYGGSYGGFLTLMAMFKKPELFACGAALRPVTDWAHYNFGYTSNILNTPDIDPEAYERSSPIYFADGLKHPLLICHGMVDDNVLFEDTVRLVQRLIELKKTHWQVAIYPVERHAFRQPTSWLDEYRRILSLFEQNLRPADRSGAARGAAQ